MLFEEALNKSIGFCWESSSPLSKHINIYSINNNKNIALKEKVGVEEATAANSIGMY